MKVHNTLTREKDEFEPITDDKVNMFVCGPTVYDYSHIGHGKTYTQFDVIVRYLRWKGYEVFYLMNITDIDDKIINRANENNGDWKKLAEEFEEKFKEDMEKLGNDAVTEYARATDHIPQIIKQVKDLQEKGFAYETEDGLYFEIDKFRDYGKLSNQDLEKIKSGARVEINEDKKNPADFVVWKKYKPGEPYWDSPWGKGRPGWHIEDTAITEEYFGPQYDVHGGAVDLIFPHHECEIAQMEAASGKEPLVKYWLHTEFLNIGKDKMSKSLGNIISIRDAISDFGKEALRYYYVSNHYRTPLEYEDENITQAGNALKRLNNFLQDVRSAEGDGTNPEVEDLCSNMLKGFEKHMDNDFDTPGVIASLFDFVKEVNKLEIGARDGERIVETLGQIDSVLNVLDFTEQDVPEDVKELAEKRLHARNEKDWDEADKLREEIKEKGYVVEDTDDGYRIKRV